MIFQRAAQREFAQTAMAVFVALFAILLTTQLIRLLGKAASGATATEAVVALLGFAALNYLPVLLSLTLFISILLCLSRSYRDSEMAIWFSSGVPLTAWMKPVLMLRIFTPASGIPAPLESRTIPPRLAVVNCAEAR
jgi:lipopolysaccharide export system permease protein